MLGVDIGRLGLQGRLRASAAGGAFDVPSLPTWSAAVRAVQANTGDARMLIVSDSTGVGAGSGATHEKDGSWPTILVGHATTDGIPAHAEAIIGNNGQGGAVAAFDGISSFGSGWTISGVTTAGGLMLLTNGAGSHSIAFPTAFDRLEIHYPRAGLGSATVNVDGGASLATLDEGPSLSWQVDTVSCALGVHTANIQRTSGGDWYEGAVIPYKSGTKQLLVLNAGWSGSRAADWVVNGAPWEPLNTIEKYGAHLTVICLTINDWNAGTTVSTYKTRLQSIIDKAKLTGDVLLMTGFPSNPSVDASVLQQQDYITANAELATTNSLDLINLTTVFTDWATANSAGYAADDKHPSGTGYAVIAQAVWDAITP